MQIIICMLVIIIKLCCLISVGHDRPVNKSCRNMLRGCRFLLTGSSTVRERDKGTVKSTAKYSQLTLQLL